MNKSQVALEFLATYAWAFIILATTISALYYFGVFDFSKYLPQDCTFPSQFKCADFSLKPAEIRMRLLNNIGEDVHVSSLQITNDAVPPISCTPPAEFDWAHGTEKDIVFTSCTGAGYIPDVRAELKVLMGYYAMNTPSHPVHLINGKINGKVLSS